MSVPIANVRLILLPPVFALPSISRHRPSPAAPVPEAPQLRLGFFRRCGAPAGEDGNLGSVDVREQPQRQFLQAHAAEQADQQHDDADGDRVADGRLDQAHGGTPVSPTA